MNKTHAYTVRFSDKEWMRLKKIEKEEQRRKSEIIRQAVGEYMDKKQWPIK